MADQTPVTFLEMSSPDLEATQAFLTDAFGWTYTEYGDDYRDAHGAGLAIGLARGKGAPPLPVLQTDDLEGMLARVQAAGGTVTKPIFDFPGGRRFEFREPGGTALAVWSES